jgi:O-antigen/teichoic acid export membrane protein
VSQGLKLNLLVVTPLVLLGMALSPWLMRLYGTEYASQWPTLMILMATAGVVAFLFPILRALHAGGHMWLTFFLNVLWSLVFISSTCLLVQHGSRGVAGARLLAFSVFAIIAAVVTARIYRDDSATTIRARWQQETRQLPRVA